MSFLSIQNLNKQYTNDVVLKNVDFNVEEGQIAVLLGKSGSGKSTLLKCINQLETPNSGSISILNDHYEFTPDYKISHKQLTLLREHVGMVFQHFHLWPHMTVLHNLTLAPMKVLKESKAVATKKAMQLLERFELVHKAEAMPSTLSGGQQQRVSIARSLMLNPKIMLLDEPTSALDPAMTHEILKVIMQLKQDNMTMLISTHEVDFAKKVADSISFLHHGNIIEQGNANTLSQPQTSELQQFLQSTQF